MGSTLYAFIISLFRILICRISCTPTDTKRGLLNARIMFIIFPLIAVTFHDEILAAFGEALSDINNLTLRTD